MELRATSRPRAAAAPKSSLAATARFAAFFFFSAILAFSALQTQAAGDAPSQGNASDVPTAPAPGGGGETVSRLSPEKLSELMQLDVEEIKKRMALLFDIIDSNKDNTIDMAEAKEWNVRLRDAMQRHQVRQEFAAIDKNKDGSVTLSELEDTYTEGGDPAQQEMHKAEVKKRFVAVDKDSDGKLSFAEVTLLMDPGKDETLLKIEVQEILASQDKNNDGKISLEEFLSTEGGTLSPQETEELTREFASYDGDADGFISEEELRQAVKYPYAHEMELLLQQLQAELGEKQSGVDRNDWTERFAVFAVSMLTDNGELLRFPEDYEGIDLPFGKPEEPQEHTDAKDEL